MDRSRATDRDEVERFLATLSDYQPTVPDALVTYYLSRAGFVTSDQRVIRLIGLAAQKFIADVGNDALAQARLRMAAESAGGGGEGRAPGRRGHGARRRHPRDVDDGRLGKGASGVWRAAAQTPLLCRLCDGRPADRRRRAVQAAADQGRAKGGASGH
eukprot:TRINITY_DN1418_c0_g1_i4.p2 TRINITY_DN1418_c0_g1~~TRINITY_DN1418_c0_g1_i4.p2  ORF type:complete len:158 (+),score=30.92 TRINITY_DN1418_c0_g1_i4:106-579(+)